MIITVGELHDKLCSKLQHLFEDFISKCLLCGAIESDGSQYSQGPGWHELVNGQLSFPERRFVFALDDPFYKDGVYDDSELPLVSMVMESMLEGHARHDMEKSLEVLTLFGFYDLDDNVVTQGPNLDMENKQWLVHMNLSQLSESRQTSHADLTDDSR